MVCACDRKSEPCSLCIDRAKNYFNKQFIQIACCHNDKMILSLASEDAEDKVLLKVYQDLGKIHLPIKEYKNNGTLIGEEIYDRMVDIQDTWVWCRKGEAWGSAMVRLIAATRGPRKNLPIFDIDKVDLELIKNELVYFGFDERDDLDYCGRFFVYDILIKLSKKYSVQEKYSKMYQKLYNLEKSGNYPSKMDEPETVIQKAVFNAIVKDLVKYFRE